MFKLYWKDELIAEQTMADNPFLSKMVALPDAPQVKLPFYLFGPNRRSVSLTKFMNWVSQDRVFPENRIGAKELLKELGLDRYDGWEIAKKTNARLGNDYYWVDFGEGDLLDTYE